MHGKTTIGWLAVALLCVAMLGLLIAGCGSETSEETTTTSMSGESTETTSAPSTTSGESTASSEAAAPEVIKVGAISFKGWNLGLAMNDTLEVMVQMTKDAGGFDVGGKKYVIEFISYDSNGDQATGISDMNRLVFEDKVQYVFADGLVVDPLIPIAEENGVVFFSQGPSPALYDAANTHTFAADGLVGSDTMVFGWLQDEHPEFKTAAIWTTEDDLGKMISGLAAASFAAIGIDASVGYFPPSQTDLSSVGTKVAAENPDVLYPSSSSAQQKGQILQVAYEAGYRGFSVEGGATPMVILSQFASAEALGNFVNMATYGEFDPALSPEAQEFRDAYTAAKGSWDYPELGFTSYFNLLIAAMQKAGSIEPEAVAEAIADGIEWSSPAAVLRMIPVAEGDAVAKQPLAGFALKTGEDGMAKLVAQPTMDQAVQWYYDIHGAMPAP